MKRKYFYVDWDVNGWRGYEDVETISLHHCFTFSSIGELRRKLKTFFSGDFDATISLCENSRGKVEGGGDFTDSFDC